MTDITRELRDDYPAVDVTEVVFSRDFAGIGCCVIPQERVLETISHIEALVKALEDCRTSYCGYAITDPAQYPEVLAQFWKEIRRIDGIAREALYPHPAENTGGGE